MASLFQNIGLFAKNNSKDVVDTFESTINFLQQRKKHKIYLESSSASILDNTDLPIIETNKIGSCCDLIIVIGGDGSLLRAARAICKNQIPILGINRGQLGFLADIPPEQSQYNLRSILEGQYIEEKRCLLNIDFDCKNKTIEPLSALNDVVLYNGDIARMIEFELFIDNNFILYQRSDGLITATPTGSTAYSLSAGGPILYPTIDAITLVPMFPHTLSSRPIVINNKSTIKLMIAKKDSMHAKISCDGQVHTSLSPGDSVTISKYKYELSLLHPQNYNYFSLLRKKLGWSTNLIANR